MASNMIGNNDPADFAAPSDREVWEVKSPSKEFHGLAREVREQIDQHLAEPPVRLGTIARRLGVKVLLSTLPRGISGQIGEENGDFVIRINRHEAKHRQRFTLAHELAHFLLHRDLIVAEAVGQRMFRCVPASPPNIEYEAGRLASDLVIPSDRLAEATAEYSGPMTSELIEDLARRFRVSTAAMEIKLQMT